MSDFEIIPIGSTDLTVNRIAGILAITIASVAGGALLTGQGQNVLLSATSALIEIQIEQPVAEVTLETLRPEISLTVTSGPPGPQGPQGDSGPPSPVFTYSGGLLASIDYADGSQKLLTYDAQGRPAQIDFTREGITTRSTFSYNPDGTVASRLDEVLA